MLKEEGLAQYVDKYFQRYVNKNLEHQFNPDFNEVKFSFKTNQNNEIDNNYLENIKISKGEESNFIWSIFYTLLTRIVEVLKTTEIKERETDKFNNLEYVFIDDPVSSLDDNHLIQQAIDIAKLVKDSGQTPKFIITTHNVLFYNVLHNELKNKNCYLLKALDNGKFELEPKKGDSNTSFAYHLHIKQIMEDAIKSNSVRRYHFMLLRNLYEKTASFLGYKDWSELLPNDSEDVQKAYASRVMNFYSHSSLSNEEMIEMTDQNKKTLKVLLDHLIDNYNFFKN